MNTATLLLFSIVALVAIATPGPTVLLALANGSHWSIRWRFTAASIPELPERTSDRVAAGGRNCSFFDSNIHPY